VNDSYDDYVRRNFSSLSSTKTMVTGSDLGAARHRRSRSLPTAELEAGPEEEEAELEGGGPGQDLASMDPAKRKRVLANRLSAARSKERKLRHAQELEAKAAVLAAELATQEAAAATAEQQVAALLAERAALEGHLVRLEAMVQQR